MWKRGSLDIFLQYLQSFHGYFHLECKLRNSNPFYNIWHSSCANYSMPKLKKSAKKALQNSAKARQRATALQQGAYDGRYRPRLIPNRKKEQDKRACRTKADRLFDFLEVKAATTKILICI